MTEVELSEQISNYGTQGMTVFTVWVSVVAGYLVVAYLAGSKLDRNQVLILNTLYIMVSLLIIFGIWGSFKVQAFYAIQIRDSYPASPHIMNYYVAFGIATGTLLGTLASLKFMRDVRCKETQTPS